MTESEMNNKIREFFKEDPFVHLVRVEDSLERGVPDLNLCDGGEYWIELKVDKPLRPEQRAWIRRRTRAGGKVCVLRWKSGLWLFYLGDRYCFPNASEVAEVQVRNIDFNKKTFMRALRECVN